MNDFWTCVLIVLAYYFGWVHAHLTVAQECERLGGFFVGNTTYHCQPDHKVNESGDE